MLYHRQKSEVIPTTIYSPKRMESQNRNMDNNQQPRCNTKLFSIFFLNDSKQTISELGIKVIFVWAVPDTNECAATGDDDTIVVFGINRNCQSSQQ